MGEPAGLTQKERHEAMALADLIYGVVNNDEGPVTVCLGGIAIDDSRHVLMDEDRQAAVLRLAQQCRDLRDALEQALNVIDPRMMSSPTVDQWRAIARPRP